MQPGRLAYSPRLDAWRGVAALMVMAYHAWWLASPGAWPIDASPRLLAFLLEAGWAGVDIFFTLSGFVLALPLLAEHSPRLDARLLRNYAWRRAARILPAFWCQLLLLGVFVAAGGVVLRGHVPQDVLGWLQQALMLFNLQPAGARPLLPVWWSLPVELAFYAVLPLLIVMIRRFGVGSLVALVIAVTGFRAWLMLGSLPANQAAPWANHLPGRLDQFLLGVLAAWGWHRIPGLHWAAHRRGLVVAGALCGLVALMLGPRLMAVVPAQSLPKDLWMAPWHGLFSALVAVLLLCALAADRAGSRCAGLTRLLSAGGAISYGIYLWHLPVLFLLAPWSAEFAGGMWRPVLLLMMALPPVLILAWGSWRWIERPVQHWSAARSAWPQH